MQGMGEAMKTMSRVRRIFDLVTLTSKQTRILELLCEGKVHKEIADVMTLSTRTVQHYVERLKIKFGARNTTQLVVFFVRQKRAL
jgi:DNA-binding NarL/FixJ family response regulator